MPDTTTPGPIEEAILEEIADRENLTDAPASQPEVRKRGKDEWRGDLPSQAEGDRDTVEDDLFEKGLDDNETN